MAFLPPNPPVATSNVIPCESARSAPSAYRSSAKRYAGGARSLRGFFLLPVTLAKMLVSKAICGELSDREIILKSLEVTDFFSCLYERYESQLLRYIKRVAFTTDEEAADILQEAFIKIWRNLHAIDQSLKLSSWLYRIVHNEAVSFLRKKRSFGKDRRVAWDEQRFADIPDDTVPGAAEELENRAQLTYRTLMQLPELYKEVLILKFMENMSYEEISDILKIPEGTVATRISRAKKAFQKIAGLR